MTVQTSNYGNVFPANPGAPRVGCPQGFSNVWTGPAIAPPTKPQNPGPRPVVTAQVQFADGSTRSMVGLYRMNFGLPAKWPTNAPGENSGWRPVRVDGSAALATWSPYLQAGVPQTSAHYDAMMAQGYVVYYLDGDLGSAGSSSRRTWPSGWWAYPGAGVSTTDMQNFQWGMSQLAGSATQVVNAVRVNAGQQPIPMPQQMVPMQGPPPPPPPGLSPLVKIGAVVVIGGILYYLL